MSEQQAAQQTTQAAGDTTSANATVQQAQVTPPAAATEVKATEAVVSGSEPASQKETGDKTVANAAPDKYELKLPENSQLDESVIERISSFAKEKGLTNDQAQQILDYESQSLDRFNEAQTEHIKSVTESWKADAVKDKEFGGEAFAKNVELAKRVAVKFGSEDFLKTLNETGLGNHPELIRVFFRVGKAMGEDTLVQANSQPAPRPRSTEELLYGNNNNNN